MRWYLRFHRHSCTCRKNIKKRNSIADWRRETKTQKRSHRPQHNRESAVGIQWIGVPTAKNVVCSHLYELCTRRRSHARVRVSVRDRRAYTVRVNSSKKWLCWMLFEGLNFNTNINIHRTHMPNVTRMECSSSSNNSTLFRRMSVVSQLPPRVHVVTLRFYSFHSFTKIVPFAIRSRYICFMVSDFSFWIVRICVVFAYGNIQTIST